VKQKLNILIIEDDKYARLNLKEILAPYGIVDEAHDVIQAKSILMNRTFDIVITDIELGEGSGVEIIPTIVRKGLPCIVVSSYENEDVIEHAYALGAKHYLAKFRLKEQLPAYINKFIHEKEARFERFLKEDFITQDRGLIEELRCLCTVNWKGRSLFISGATGTGKSLLGKLVHQITHPEANLVHLNCAEVAENLLESELFGHEKGAFTGADQKKDGKLRLAHGGTLFLDEVGTMPMAMQQKLLKALDEKTFYPVGSGAPVKCEFTLVSATCEDLQEKIREKKFREDLYYRITGFTFHLRPLAERRQDIPLLIKYYQQKSSRRFVIKPEALELLNSHSWPGNIRELFKVCDRLSQNVSGILTANDVRPFFTNGPTGSHSPESWEEHVFTLGLRSYIARLEKRAVEESLKRNNGKITSCIKELKISSSAFYRILQEHQLQL
jgi:DNA-binding NtrC family response regulator